MQHYDRRGQYDVALCKIDEAIAHTPTVIDLYSVKVSLFIMAKNLRISFWSISFFGVTIAACTMCGDTFWKLFWQDGWVWTFLVIAIVLTEFLYCVHTLDQVILFVWGCSCFFLTLVLVSLNTEPNNEACRRLDCRCCTCRWS